jgi:CSLREA domain-containing protein
MRGGIASQAGSAVLSALFILLAVTPAQAAQVTVSTTTADEFDAVPNGFCSLREAVQTANGDADFATT